MLNCFQQLPLLTLAAQRACSQSRESLLGRQSRKHSWKQSLENNLDMIASQTDTKMRSKQTPLVSCLEAWALKSILLGWVLFVCCAFALCSTSAARVPKLSQPTDELEPKKLFSKCTFVCAAFCAFCFSSVVATPCPLFLKVGLGTFLLCSFCCTSVLYFAAFVFKAPPSSFFLVQKQNPFHFDSGFPIYLLQVWCWLLLTLAWHCFASGNIREPELPLGLYSLRLQLFALSCCLQLWNTFLVLSAS